VDSQTVRDVTTDGMRWCTTAQSAESAATESAATESTTEQADAYVAYLGGLSRAAPTLASVLGGSVHLGGGGNVAVPVRETRLRDLLAVVKRGAATGADFGTARQVLAYVAVAVVTAAAREVEQLAQAQREEQADEADEDDEGGSAD
jgi:hypothetical protein